MGTIVLTGKKWEDNDSREAASERLPVPDHHYESNLVWCGFFAGK
jgi:hypothetical protein